MGRSPWFRSGIHLAAALLCAVPTQAQVEVAREYSDLNGPQICPGDIVRFTVTVTNPGGSQSPATVSDPVDKDCFSSFVVSMANPDSPFATGGFDQSTQPIGGSRDGIAKVAGFTLPARSQLRLLYDATVWSGAQVNTRCCNRATIAYGLELEISPMVCVTIDCLPPGTPNLLSVKTASVSGRTITYTITVNNSGSGPDDNIEVVDSLDADAANFQLVSTSHGTPAYSPPPAGAYGNGQLTVSNFSLDAGETATIVFSVDAPPTCGSGSTRMCNQAEVTSTGIQAGGGGPRLTDANPVDQIPNQATCVTLQNSQAPLVDAVKSEQLVSGTDHSPGARVRYTLQVSNPSSCPATDEVIDDIPAGLTFDLASVTVTGSGGFTNNSTSIGGANGTGLVNITDLIVATGQTALITFDAVIATGTEGQSICNSADYRLLPFGLIDTTNPVCFDVPSQVCAVLPEPIQLLKGVKASTPQDATFSWQPESSSSLGYVLYRVTSGPEIAQANRNANPPSLLNACATVIPSAVSCRHVGALGLAPNLGFYQVVGVCGNGQEGPN